MSSLTHISKAPFFRRETRFYTSRTRGSLGAREFSTNDSDGARTGARSLPTHAESSFFPAGKFSRSNRARSRRKECFIPKSVRCCTIVQKFKFYALEFQNSTIINIVVMSRKRQAAILPLNQHETGTPSKYAGGVCRLSHLPRLCLTRSQ